MNVCLPCWKHCGDFWRMNVQIVEGNWIYTVTDKPSVESVGDLCSSYELWKMKGCRGWWAKAPFFGRLAPRLRSICVAPGAGNLPSNTIGIWTIPFFAIGTGYQTCPTATDNPFRGWAGTNFVLFRYFLSPGHWLTSFGRWCMRNAFTPCENQHIHIGWVYYTSTTQLFVKNVKK